jgi:hypothetical protein
MARRALCTDNDANPKKAASTHEDLRNSSRVDLLGRYSNPNILSRIRQILAGQA